MIESSGQILTGRAATDLAAVIEVVEGADGFHRSYLGSNRSNW